VGYDTSISNPVYFDQGPEKAYDIAYLVGALDLIVNILNSVKCVKLFYNI